MWRDLHDVSHRFKSIRELRFALHHELEDEISDNEDYSLGYFEGRQQKKKWLVSPSDLEAMYVTFEGKTKISLWCEGKQIASDHDTSGDEEPHPKRRKKNKSDGSKKINEREDELENVFRQLKEKHQDNFSGPQLRLWARMIVAKTHDNLDEPPKVPMITGNIQRNQKRESLTDAFVGAATAIAQVLSPTSVPKGSSPFSPSKKINLRMKNLEQLRQLQQLYKDGILSEDEFDSQKKIVLTSLDTLA